MPLDGQVGRLTSHRGGAMYANIPGMTLGKKSWIRCNPHLSPLHSISFFSIFKKNINSAFQQVIHPHLDVVILSATRGGVSGGGRMSLPTLCTSPSSHGYHATDVGKEARCLAILGVSELGEISVRPVTSMIFSMSISKMPPKKRYERTYERWNTQLIWWLHI